MRILKKLFRWWATISILTAVAGMIVKRTVKVEADPAGSRFSLVSVFDGTDFRPTTQTLTSSKALTVFGGTRIDLRRARLETGTVRLDVTTVFGGTDVTVPDDWAVTVDGAAMAGGHEVQVTDPETLPDDAPRLAITAWTLLGGLRIQARPVLTSAETG